jgi:hypothetical protein
MTQTEFISQLDETKKRGRGLLYSAFIVIMGINAAVFYWAIVYRVQSSRSHFLVSGVVLTALWSVAAGGFILLFKRHSLRFSPRCPACHKQLTWRERDTVVESKKCPFCQMRIIHESGA